MDCVTMPRPSDRLEILRALSRRLAMGSDVDLMELALATEGMTGEAMSERGEGGQ